MTFEQVYLAAKRPAWIGRAKMFSLYSGVKYVLADGIAGDVVECGVAKGGSALVLAAALAGERHLWLFDTFEGLPKPSKKNPDYKKAMTKVGGCRGTIEQVKALLEQHDLLEGACWSKGLYERTLKRPPVTQIALLHIDCDWYESYKAVLDALYDRVSPGGLIQMDDYGHWQGARKAVDEFFKRRKIDPQLITLDPPTGRLHIKPMEATA